MLLFPPCKGERDNNSPIDERMKDGKFKLGETNVKCRGLRFFLCPTLVTCGSFHFHICFTELKISYLSFFHQPLGTVTLLIIAVCRTSLK